MPYFKWYAVNHTGTVQSGLTQARDATDLDYKLHTNSMTLMRATPCLHKSFFRPIRSSTRSSFYRQLGVLLDAGIYLDRALDILANQITHSIFKDIIIDIRTTISHGAPFHTSCSYHSHIFTAVDQGLLQAGQETGQLAQSCLLLADYHEQKAVVLKKIRSSLLMPAITFMVFIIIALIIILVLVPLFAELFISMGQPLPEITRKLVTIATFFQSTPFYVLLAIFLLAAICLRNFGKKRFQPYIAYVTLSMPVWGTFIYEKELLFFLQSLSLLTEGKIPIARALNLAANSISNGLIQKQIGQVVQEVEQGQSLYWALQNNQVRLSADCLALINTGQESSNLAFMLKQATKLYQDRVNRRLLLFSTVLQPIVMIILGLLILSLIVSIYSPIFTISLNIA